MSIRAALEDLLAGHGPDADPAAVLSEHGFEDLPPEALSSALLHFAEQAPIEVADALSPIVTRLSDVPFEDGDLTPHPGVDAILADGGSVFDLLDELGLSDEAPHADPSELDVEDDFDHQTVVDEGHPHPDDDLNLDHHDDHDDHTFGSGDDEDEHEIDMGLEDDTDPHFDDVFDGIHPIGSDELDPVDDLDGHTPVHAEDLDGLLSPADHDHPIDDDDPLDFDLE
jgi:hypothetical protein